MGPTRWRRWLVVTLIVLVAALLGYEFTPAWLVFTVPTATNYAVPTPVPGTLVYCGTRERWMVCTVVYPGPGGWQYEYVAHQGLHVHVPISIVMKEGWGRAATWHRLYVWAHSGYDVWRVPNTGWPPTVIYSGESGTGPVREHLAQLLASQRWTITEPGGQQIVINPHRQRRLTPVWPPPFAHRPDG